MGKIEEQRLAEVRAQILAARQAAGQNAAPQGSSPSITSSTWVQRPSTTYVQEIPVIEQPRNCSANDTMFAEACVRMENPVASAGLSTMSVNDKVPASFGIIDSVYGHSSRSMYSRHSIGGLSQRPTDVFHHKTEFEPGVVFSAVTHEHHYRQDRIDHSNANQTETNFGITNSKFRKFVVLLRFEHHVIALPILTHQGRGLSSKRHKEEFVSVRDRMAFNHAAPAESRHGILWAETYPDFRYASAWHRMSDTCCLHITKPYSHNMDHKCTISGRLENESFLKLQRLFRNAVLRDTATSISQTIPRGPGSVVEASPTTPRGVSFSHTKTSVHGVGPRQTNGWLSGRSNFSQFSITARYE